MNFQQITQANGNKLMMFGVFTQVGGAEFSQQGKPKSKCKIRDDNNEEHTVHIYQGTGQLPMPQNLGQRYQFSISSFQGTTQQGQVYTGYSGFWQSGTQVNQNAQQAPQQPAQATNYQSLAPQTKKEPDWDAKDLRMARMNALTNSTKLICLMAESNVEKDTDKDRDRLVNLVTFTAEIIVNYIYKGLSKKLAPEKPQYQANPNWIGENPPPPTDDQVPF